jgi:hypothetical protein
VFLAIIWLPTSKGYRYCDDALIQRNDGVIGFEEFYYTRINLPHFVQQILPFKYYLPPFAVRTVALTGAKQVGTQFDTKLRICWDGFFIMVIFTSIIIYVFFWFYVFFEKKLSGYCSEVLKDVSNRGTDVETNGSF